MTHTDEKNAFEKSVRLLREAQPSHEQLNESSARLWRQLQTVSATNIDMIRGCDDVRNLLVQYRQGQLSSERAAIMRTHLHECVECRRIAEGKSAPSKGWTPAAPTPQRIWPRFAMAAATVIVALSAFLLHNTYFAIPAGARATVQSIEGSVYQVSGEGDRLLSASSQLNDGDVVRTSAGAHAFLKLSDGSIVEVNERTTFSVQARGKNTTVALQGGSVLVQAAKRSSGHLYVKTPDARVAVTGTVFSVNSGVKGSRVSVVEGTVEVDHGGSEDVLYAGDQVSTGGNMEPVPVDQDISWSRNREKHLELLAEMTKLRHRLEQVQLPAPRFNSTLLSRMPADLIVYASIPNAGQALEDANRIFQEQMQQSPALREWWGGGKPEVQSKLNETIAKVRQLSDYLGDEIVIAGVDSGGQSSMAIVAEVRRSGLREFLQTQFASGSENEKLTVLTPSNLPRGAAKPEAAYALVGDNEVIFSNRIETLAKVHAQFATGTPGLAATEFGQRLAEAYSRGAGFLFAADLYHVVHSSKSSRGRRRDDAGLERSGFGDMRYLIVEHREINGVPDNRMVLDFRGERHGMASWLAAPGQMGSLDFVSRNAAVAVAFVTKDPQLMFDDILRMARNQDRTQHELNDAEAKLHMRIRDDLAAHFGGDAVLALDGPVLPTPAWKFVVEVHDSAALAASLQKLVSAVNEEARSKGEPEVEFASDDINGQKYYSVTSHAAGATAVHYTFASGYMIIGPSRAVVMNTLRTRATGDSLARSGEFKALLPKDANANYSAIAYQNLSPILQPLLSQLNGEQARLVQQLAADSKPSTFAAWGRGDRIEAATNSPLLGLDWLTLGSLLGSGTSHRSTP